MNTVHQRHCSLKKDPFIVIGPMKILNTDSWQEHKITAATTIEHSALICLDVSRRVSINTLSKASVIIGKYTVDYSRRIHIQAHTPPQSL